MDTRGARRVLIIAVALSVLLHLIVALSLHPHRGEATPGIERVAIEHRMAIVRRTPPPPPRRTPPPVAVASRAPLEPHPAATRGSAARAAAVAPAATPVPTPAPTPLASAATCTQPDAPASLLATPPPPNIPVAARAAGTSGTTRVRVALDPAGTVIGTAIAQSSGNPALDAIALTLASAARYAPALRACKPVPGSYGFTVEFVAW